MTLAAFATLLYGLLGAVGGIFGYVKARSRVSLIAGLVSGCLLIACGILQLQGVPWATPGALAISSVLAIVFCVRLAKTGKWMPAGLMVVTGTATVLVLAARLFIA